MLFSATEKVRHNNRLNFAAAQSTVRRQLQISWVLNSAQSACSLHHYLYCALMQKAEGVWNNNLITCDKYCQELFFSCSAVVIKSLFYNNNIVKTLHKSSLMTTALLYVKLFPLLKWLSSLLATSPWPLLGSLLHRFANAQISPLNTTFLIFTYCGKMFWCTGTLF